MTNEVVHLPHDWYPEPLPANVTFGDGTWIYSSFAFLHHQSTRPSAVRIGAHSGIYNGTFFDLGPEGEVEIGDYCAVVGAVIATNDLVRIDDYAFIAHEVVIADSPWAAPAPHERCAESPSVIIGENAWVGARAVLLAGARLGRGAILGAAAVLDVAVPDFAIAAGNPARVVGWAKPQSVESGTGPGGSED